MKNKKILLKQLEEISEILAVEYKEVYSHGALVGNAGIAMFQFYYSKFTQDQHYSNLGMEILEDCFNKANAGGSMATYCVGLAGTGWTVDHLAENGLIENENDDLLSSMDESLYKIMLADIKEKRYDFLHGALGYGFYFLKRMRNTQFDTLKEKYRTYLIELVSILDEISIQSDGKIKWHTMLKKETGDWGYNLGLSHGIPSIINFLSRLYHHRELCNKVEPLLRGSIEYVLSVRLTGKASNSIFPNWVKDKNDDKKSSRLAWCYGDIGVGISLWRAATSLEDESLKEKSLEILKHSSKRVSPESNKVIDAGVCHGSYGNAQIFNRLYEETGIIDFKKAADFWINDGLEKATYHDGFVGYKQWNGGSNQWEKDVSVLEGIAGIGLTIMSYLSGDNSWDECLMIG